MPAIGIEEYRLAGNGLRVLCLEARAAPVAVLMLTYAVGSADEGPGFAGASHLLEHMMFKGTPRFNRRQRNSISDLLHPSGAQCNATTWLDRTNYFSLVPIDQLELAAEIEADRMQQLLLDAGELEAERGVVLNEHDQVSGDPLERLNQAVWSAAFAGHGYGAPVLGSRDDILALTREQLFEHHQRWYRPDNATLSVIGDVDREQVLELATRHFGAPPRGHCMSPRPPVPAQFEERRVMVEQEEPPGWVLLAWRGPAGTHPDADALELLGAILAGSKLSRLYPRLVASGLALGAWPGSSRLRQAGLFQVQAMLAEGAEHEAVEQVIRDAIAEFRLHGVAPQELEHAHARLRGQLLTSRDGPLAMAMQLNEAIAAGDWRAYPSAADRLAEVTADDVQRVAHQYLRDRQLTVGHLVATSA